MHKHRLSQEADENEINPVLQSVSDTGDKLFNRDPLVLEIFAGSCRLSKACRDIGFGATAVLQLQCDGHTDPLSFHLWHRSQHREPSKLHPLAVLHDDQVV